MPMRAFGDLHSASSDARLIPAGTTPTIIITTADDRSAAFNNVFRFRIVRLPDRFRFAFVTPASSSATPGQVPGAVVGIRGQIFDT